MNEKAGIKRARLGIGVSFDKKRGGKNYKTRIHFKSREVLLGRYKTCHEARLAYDQAALMLAKVKEGVGTNYPPGSYEFYDPSVERKVLALLEATEADATACAASGAQQQQPQAVWLMMSAAEAHQPPLQSSNQLDHAWGTSTPTQAAGDVQVPCSSGNSSSSNTKLVRQDSQVSHQQQQQQPHQQPWQAQASNGCSNHAVSEPSRMQLPLVVCDAPLDLLLQAISDLPSKIVWG